MTCFYSERLPMEFCCLVFKKSKPFSQIHAVTAFHKLTFAAKIR